MLQELSDDQLEMVNGGGGNTYNITYNITYITIVNSQLINSPVGSFDGNVNSTVVYSETGNVTATFKPGGNGGGSGSYCHSRNFFSYCRH